MEYQIVSKADYDIELELGIEKMACYSTKKMKQLTLANNIQITGEIFYGGKKMAVGYVQVGGTYFKVFQKGTYSSLLYRKAGYVCVGGNNYITILESRVPFLIWMLVLILILAGLFIYLSSILTSGEKVLYPDNPLPPVDPYVEEIPNEGEQVEKDEGGSVSMSYTLEAKMSLETNVIDIYFKNPSVSTHDVVVELYVLSDDGKTLIATSGRIPAGTGLYQMDFDTKAAVMSEGQYSAMYKVYYYNPDTGECDLITSDIKDVILTVTK